MTTLPAQDEEARELGRKYELLSAYCEVGLARVQFISDFFKKVAATLRQSMGTIAAAGMTKDRKSEAEFGAVSAFYEFVSQFARAQETFGKEFEQTADMIEQVILPILQTLLDELAAKLEKSRKEIEVVEKARAVCSEKLAKMMKNVEKQLDETKKAYAHLQKLQEHGTGQDKKYCETVAEKCKEYRTLIKMSVQATDDLNAAHHKYAAAVSAEMAELCASESDRANRLMILFEMFLPNFGRVSEVFEGGKSCLEKVKLNWEPDFINFVKSERIMRGNLPAEKCSRFVFSFEDDDLKPPPPEPTVECVDAPVMLAKAATAFEGTGKYQMTVKAGDMLYLYELPKYDWCYAANATGDKMGYVPSKILEVDSRDLALVVKMHIPAESSGLMVALGDVVVVESREQKGAMCVGRDGERGFIPADCLLFKTSS